MMIRASKQYTSFAARKGWRELPRLLSSSFYTKSSASFDSPAFISLRSSSYSAFVFCPSLVPPSVKQKSDRESQCIRRSGFCTHSGTNDRPVPTELREKIEILAKTKLADLQLLKKSDAKRSLGEITVAATVGGMRGVTCLLTETSELHPEHGITFRGYTIHDLQKSLPRPSPEDEPYPEGLLWLMLTGQLPSAAEVSLLSNELLERSEIPPHTWCLLNDLPKTTHPMTQMVVAMTSLQTESRFAAAYKKGITKREYWLPTLEDALSLIAKVPRVAAYIYRRSFKDGKEILPSKDLDWAANFMHMLGFDSHEQFNLMRLYLLLHGDHEGGNVSAHTAHLVGSALSDPYLCYSASMAGLAGPLHGLANQECLNWLLDAQSQLKGEPATPENIAAIAKKTLESGRVIPGYGHAVLRTTDPRFLAQREFALRKLPDFDLFKLLNVCYQTIPEILFATGKVSNPYPNVDCHSGVLLQYFGLKEAEFYTVLFGVSRAMGITGQLVWSRILGLPIERPKSITVNTLMQDMQTAKK